MQRLTLIALAALAVSMTACKKKQPVEYVQEGTSQLTSVVNVADPRAGVQMLRGFHELESNSWRWTAAKFAVAMRPPKDATAGAKVYLEMVAADAVVEKVGLPTISVTVEGRVLAPVKITKTGPQRVEWDVPAELLKGDVVTAEFSVDKFLAAGQVEQRELGLIVSIAGLQTPKAAPPAAK